jgi:pimeloyl-ACP methyl ester carboxylesterase
MAFVLVHGGCFTSACWDAVVPQLTGEVLAVDLPGRGKHPADLRRITVNDWAASVVADIEAAGYDDVVLVGHSLAGLTLPRVAALIPDKVRQLVFVSCAVPRDGQTLQGALDDNFDERVSAETREHTQPDNAPTVMPRELATVMFCNDMDPADTERTLDLMVPDATTVLSEPLDMAGLLTSIPRTWVRLTQDAVVTPETQDAFIANCGPATDVIDLDAAHMAMISRPKELAEILNRLA